MTSEILDRLPPQNLAAEKCIIGAICIDPACIDDVCAVVSASDFHTSAHATLFRNLVEMRMEQTPVDGVLLLGRLKASGHLESIGGAAYIGEIINATPSAANVIHYAELVHETAVRRSLIHSAMAAVRSAWDSSEGAEQICDRLSNDLMQILSRGKSGEARLVAEIIPAVLERAKLSRSSGRQGGLPVGLCDVDSSMGGMFPGELFILAARPGMGKTSLAGQIATHNAERGSKVLFVSLEMSDEELMSRLLCAKAGVDGSRMRTGRLDDRDIDSLVTTAGEFQHAPLSITNSASMTTAEIVRLARKAKQKQGLDLLVVDYLGRVEASDRRNNRVEQVSQMARDFKRAARDLDLPLLCLAQLNRAAESQTDRRPRLSHLRESGEIEQEADVVAFLHREEVYNKKDQDLRGQADLLVLKNRNGPVGEYPLLWDAATTTLKTRAIRAADNFDYEPSEYGGF